MHTEKGVIGKKAGSKSDGPFHAIQFHAQYPHTFHLINVKIDAII